MIAVAVERRSKAQAGMHSEPLFGVDWDTLWDRSIEEVRADSSIDRSSIVGAGILAAA